MSLLRCIKPQRLEHQLLIACTCCFHSQRAAIHNSVIKLYSASNYDGRLYVKKHHKETINLYNERKTQIQLARRRSESRKHTRDQGSGSESRQHLRDHGSGSVSRKHMRDHGSGYSPDKPREALVMTSHSRYKTTLRESFSPITVKRSSQRQSSSLPQDGNLWRISKGIHARLRKDILVQPKFRGQVVMPSFCVMSLMNEDDHIDKSVDYTQDMIRAVTDIHALMQTVNKLNDEERIDVLRLIQNECCSRVDDWTVKQILLAMDLFYCGEFFALSFHKVASKLIDLKLSRFVLQPKDIVQYLFFVCIFREVPLTLMQQLEDMVRADFNEYTPEEVGIICTAYFVTNNSVKSQELLEKIAQTLTNDMPQSMKYGTPSILCGNYLKVLRQAHYSHDRKFLHDLGNTFVDYISLYNVHTMMQVYKTYSSFLYHHPTFCQKFLDFWNKDNVGRLRFKDLVDIMWGCAVFEMRPPQVLIEELMRYFSGDYTSLSKQYPRKFTEGLLSFTLLEIYPFRAINHTLSMHLVEAKHVDQLEQIFQYQLLSETMAVRCPDYHGNHLPKDWHSMGRNKNIRSQLEWRSGIAVLLSTIQSILGNHNLVSIDTLIKHSPIPDLLIYLNESNVPVEMPIPDQHNCVSEFDRSVLCDVTGAVLVDEDHVAVQTEWVDTANGDKDNNSIMHTILSNMWRRNPECFHLRPESKIKCRKLVVKVLGWNQYWLNEDRIHGLHMHALHLMLEQDYEIIAICPPVARKVEAMSQGQREDFVCKEILDKFEVKY